MPSSTSSSRAAHRGRAVQAAVLFAAAFLACAVAGQRLARPGGALAYAWPNPSPDDLPAGSWYAHYRRGTRLESHSVLYQGAGASIDNARRADVLFLGNSRLGMGLDVAEHRGFAEATGLRTFDLSLGDTEGVRFAAAILDEHDLRPPLAVVNADRFFSQVLSRSAQRVQRTSRWERWREAREGALAFAWRTGIGANLPHFVPRIPVPLDWRAEDVWTIYRSEDDGAWFPWHTPSLDLPVDPGTGSDELRPRELETARAFLARQRSHGGSLVLTLVPTTRGDGSLRRAQALAEALQVPLLAPRPEGLVTRDGSHLDDRSARLWSQAFFEALAAHPHVEALRSGR